MRLAIVVVALVVIAAGAAPLHGPLPLHARAAAAVALAIAGLQDDPAPPAPNPPAPPSPDGGCPSACEGVDGFLGDRAHRSPCTCLASCRCKATRGPTTPTPPPAGSPCGGKCQSGVYEQGGASRKCFGCSCGCQSAKPAPRCTACLDTRAVMGVDGVVRACSRCSCAGGGCAK